MNEQINRKQKRLLSKYLIKHIVNLYDLVIEKIQHGIGLLWEQYFSQEIFNMAKKRVENQLISNLSQLNHWFSKISKSIRQKVNILSDNLISHFNDIIKQQQIIFYSEIHKIDQKAIRQSLVDNQFEQRNSFNKQEQITSNLKQINQSQQKHQRQIINLIESDQSISQFQRITINLSQHDTIQDQSFMKEQEKFNLQQQDRRCYQNGIFQQVYRQSGFKKQNLGNKRKHSQNELFQNESVEADFYGVVLGLLDVFSL